MVDVTVSSDIRWFANVRNSDTAIVGGKNASFGEMYAEVSKVA
jgi:phosphoenolpyruvate synthase/pyruvate phosphate dikinase